MQNWLYPVTALEKIKFKAVPDIFEKYEKFHAYTKR